MKDGRRSADQPRHATALTGVAVGR